MIHHVFANRSNIGDWLSARGVQLFLGSNVEEHLCDEPFVNDTLSALAETGPEDVVVVGGGGLFMDYFRPFWEGLLALSTPAPLCVWGVGVVDIKREMSRLDRSLLHAIADRAAVCAVRDELTREQLPADHHAVVALCPSILAVSVPSERGDDVLHVVNMTTVGGEEYEVMCTTARAFAAETGRMYHQTNNRVRTGNAEHMERVVKRYAAADVVVTSALHGCILAAAMGRPVVAVSGDWKIEQFMSAAGLSEWVLQQEEVDRLPAMLRAVSTQQPAAELRARASHQNARVAEDVLAIVKGARV